MNRNVESHFALSPTSIDIGRSQFDRSSGIKFTGNVGDLIPFYVDEVLPGDTFKVTTSKVVRLQTLLHPIMDNMYLDTYFFYVKMIDIWDHAANFFGESAKAWTPTVEYRIPKINITQAGLGHPHPGVGSLADYMGIPLGVATDTASGQNPKGGINALPFRAYAKVCNDWFRPESLCDELVIPTGDADVDINAKSASDLYCAYGGPVFKACKYHDYFTSALPAPQCGPSVAIPTTGVLAPVGTYDRISKTYSSLINRTSLKFDDANNHTFTQGDHNLLLDVATAGQSGKLFAKNTGESSTSSGSSLYPENLWADLTNSFGTINALRQAFQVQKFYEKLSRGRRYVEILKAQFGITAPDAELHRSEYLGGNRIPINVNEVTNNSKDASNYLGDLGAMSRTNDVHADFVHSFTQHGYIIGVCVIRYDHSYPQGLERFWQRTTPFDFYWPVFANIGEQAVRRGEICFTVNGDGDEFSTFGYQEYAAEYRYKPSRVAGLLRPEASGSLASWHLGDYYDQTDPSTTGPFLSDSWIREDKTNVDRTLAVTSSVSDQFLADFYIQNICTRVMPMYSIPGLADHH